MGLSRFQRYLDSLPDDGENPFSYQPWREDIVDDPDYHRLWSSVMSGDVLLDVLIAPPRTGSTATTLHLTRTLGYDGCLLEPEAWLKTEDSRISQLCRQVNDLVDDLPDAHEGRRPHRLLLKVMSNQYGPMRDMQSLMRLSNKVGFLMRNPVLSFESSLLFRSRLLPLVGLAPLTRADLIESGLVSPETDLSHIKAPEACTETAWAQHVAHMQACRDYSSLTPRLLEDTLDLYRQPEFQSDLERWHRISTGLISGYVDRPQNFSDVGASDKSSMDDMLEGWHFGWNSLAAFHWAMAMLHSDYTPDPSTHKFFVLDFDALSEERDGFSQTLSALWDMPLRGEDGPACLVRYGYGGADIEESFSSVAFDRARRQKNLEPSDRCSLPVESFPRFVLPHLRDAIFLYRGMTEHRLVHAVQPSSRSSSLLSGLFNRSVDPVRSAAILSAQNNMDVSRVHEMMCHLFDAQGEWMKQYGIMASMVPVMARVFLRERLINSMRREYPSHDLFL